MKPETKTWIKIAKEDHEIAQEMWDAKRYIYAIMFYQQAVEKILKAYIVEVIDKLPKKTHDIDLLLKDAKLDIKELKIENMKDVSLAFIRTRYEDLSRQYYSKKTTVQPLITKAETIYLWIENKLKNL